MAFPKNKIINNNYLTDLNSLIDHFLIAQNTSSLLNGMLEKLAKIFSADMACFYAPGPDRRYYRKVSSFSPKFPKNQERSGNIEKLEINDILKTAIIERKTLFVYNKTILNKKQPKLSAQKKVTRIIIPIEAKDDVLALIELSIFKKVKPTSNDMEFCNTIGNIISLKYSNWLTKKQRDREIDFLRNVLTITYEDLDPLYQNLYKALSSLINYKFIALWLYNEPDDALVIRSFYPDYIGGKKVNFDDFDNKIASRANSLCGEVISTKKMKVFKSVNSLENFKNRRFAKKYGLKWFASFPILDAENATLGVLNMWPFGSPGDFNPEIRDAISSYLSSLAKKIQLVGFENVENLLYAYDNIFANMIEFKDYRASWDKIASIISDQMKCEACSIFFLESNNRLYLKGSTGIAGSPPYEDVWYTPGQGLTGTALLSKQPIIYYPELKQKFKNIHISKHREIMKQTNRSESILFYRILDRADNPVGVIRCVNKIKRSTLPHISHFTKEDFFMLQKISKLIANLYYKAEWIYTHEKEREKSLNSLHHEILSPIDAILSHIEWIEFHLSKYYKGNLLKESDSKLALKFSDIIQNAKLVEMLVTTMGQFEEDIVLNMKQFSFNEVLQVCAGLLYNEAKRKNVDIKIQCGGLPKIEADELQIMRVCYNLLRNAIKYRDRKERFKYVSILGIEKNDQIVLRFEDNGIGIIATELQIIFTKFERGSNACEVFPEGTGLGLAYCKAIVGKHGGKIFVDPVKYGKPTVFQLELPKY